MDRSADEQIHDAPVGALLERASDCESSIEIISLFRSALEAVWSRAVTTLGAVTLTAIVERVLHTAAAKHAFLSAVNPHPNGDARWKQHLQDRLAQVPRAELLSGLRFGLVELLTVTGRLTGEILSDELHAAIRDALPSDAAPKPVTGAHDVLTTKRSKVQL